MFMRASCCGSLEELIVAVTIGWVLRGEEYSGVREGGIFSLVYRLDRKLRCCVLGSRVPETRTNCELHMLTFLTKKKV